MLNVPRPVGLASILLFAVMLALAVWGVTRGGAQPHEEPGASHSDVVVVSMELDEATIQCVDGFPRLWLQSAEDLPAGAVVTVRPSRELPTESADTREFEAVGAPQRFSVPSATRAVETVLDEAATPADADVVAIYVTANTADGARLQSPTKFLDADTLKCAGGS